MVYDFHKLNLKCVDIPMKNKIFVANWKLNKSYAESLQWYAEHEAELRALSEEATIVLCPTFPAIAPLASQSSGFPLKIGAQNCAAFDKGSFTGEVSAQSLKEAGCGLCIVGHSERRRLYHETDKMVWQKVKLLLEQQLTPIICIGETEEGLGTTAINKALEEQLKGIESLHPSTPLRMSESLSAHGDPSAQSLCSLLGSKRNPPDWSAFSPEPGRRVVESMQRCSEVYPELCRGGGVNHKEIYIAYEPAWAIGSQKTPNSEKLQEIISWLQVWAKKQGGYTIAILYGGSVNPETVVALKRIKEIDGFLIGNGSLDWRSFALLVQYGIEQ
jgi:triosephosphate isomerase